MERLLQVEQFDRRVIVSGKVCEIYVYEKPVAKGFAKKSVGRSNAPFTSQEQKQENRNKTAARARAIVRRTANANADTLTKFLTLTFAENLTDIKAASYEFDKFIKRMKTRYPHLEYIKVTEFQKRGAIHFHLLHNLPYVDVNKIAKIWGNGFVKINRIDNVDNIGAYVTKYMNKDCIDKRLAGKKCYTMSKGLKAPVTLTDESDIDEMMTVINSMEEKDKRTYFAAFDSDYYGTILYKQIVCKNPIPLPWGERKTSPPHDDDDLLQLLPDDTPTPFDDTEQLPPHTVTGTGCKPCNGSFYRTTKRVCSSKVERLCTSSK
jgi:hypothetical protein